MRPLQIGITSRASMIALDMNWRKKMPNREKGVKMINELEGGRKKPIMRLWEHACDNGFDVFPASTSPDKHNAYEGGLLDHSVSVAGLLQSLNRMLGDAWHKEGVYSKESCLIVGLFHDLHKAFDGYGRPYYLESYNKDGSRSKKPYEVNKNIVKLAGGYVSLRIIEQFVPMLEDEAQAIAHHDGLYVPEGRVLQVGDVVPLTKMLHFCDFWCGIFCEKTGGKLRTLEERNRDFFCDLGVTPKD
jgi:hypothetical protein